MNKKTWLLFILLYGTMFFFGYIDNIKAVSYPLSKTEFAISYGQQGALVSIQSLGYVIFSLVGGMLLERIGTKKTFMAGFVFLTLSLMGIYFMRHFLSFAASLIFMAAAFGILEISVTALSAQVFITRTALLMNLLHFSYGIGSSISPRIAGAIAVALGWRESYLLSIPIILIFFIYSLYVRYPQSAFIYGLKNDSSPDSSNFHKEEKAQEKVSFKEPKKLSFFIALKTPMIWLFSIVLCLMIVLEASSATWAGLYFQDVYQLDPKTTGAAFISNFFICFTVSRLVSGFIIEKVGYVRSLFIAVFASFFIYVLGFLLGAKGIYVFPALGIFVAIFWPTTLATAMAYFKEDAPVMTSAIIVFVGGIGGGIQFLIGLTNRFLGPAWGYRSHLVYNAILIFFLIYLARCIRRPYKR